MTELGERIGPFEIAERLSLGPRASLWRGRRVDGADHRTRDVVLRVAEDPSDTAVVTALQEEYEALRAMGDDRLPRAVGFYAGRGAVAIEHVPGIPLRELLRAVGAGRVDLDLATAVDLLIEVAYAMRHAHSIVRDQGRIVHGSLDADDVRIGPDGRVVVCGFGAVDRPPGASPEQKAGSPVDARTDQWLLGALALDVLRFTKEIAPGGPLEDASAVLAGLQGVSPGLHRVVIRMLARSPGQRHTPEDRMLSELLAVARQVGGVSRRAETAAKAIAHAPDTVGIPKRLSVEALGPPPTIEIQRTPPVVAQPAMPPPEEDVTTFDPTVEGEPEPAPPPRWRPPRVRSGAQTLAAIPKPKHVAPPPPPPPPAEPEVMHRTGLRPEIKLVPDWMVLVTILILAAAGALALWMRFGRG